jgi:phage-related minor tail protein
MASTRVRGITIELDADTSGISKGLKSVNSEIRSTQKQLKDVDRLLKLDPTNTQLLEQKQRLLQDAVGETKNKLETLKKAQEEVGKTLKETGEGQEQYDALTREIVSCEQELKKAEKAASSFNVTAQKISATAEKMGAGLSKAADKTRGLSMAAGGALVALGGAAYKAAQSADDLNTLAKQTGFTTAQLQKMQYAAERIDVPMETITSAAAKMTKQLSSSESKFTDLGVATRNADGSFRSVNNIFNDTVQALSEIPNETERDAAAMEIFGKSANELAGVIDDGGASLRALGEEAENLGVIIPQDQLDAANQLNDEIDKLKAEGMGTFAALGTEVVEMVLPYIPKVAEAIEQVLKFIKELDPDVLKLAVAVIAATAALSPMMSALSGVASGVSAVSSAISFLCANPIVLLIAAIIALVALIAVKGDEIQNKLQQVDDYVQNIFAKDWSDTFGSLGEGLNVWSKLLSDVWNNAMTIMNGVIDFIRGVFTGDWDRAWKGVQNIFKGYFGQFAAIAKIPLNGVIALINGVIGGINRMVDSLNSISFDIPDWVPELGGRSFGLNLSHVGKVPYLANGGILSQGSAIVGEAGAELLTMSGGRAIVQPLTNNTANYAGSTNNFYIQSTDPEQVAEEVATILNNQVQRQQYSWA